jgi:hypothetical protein
LSSSIDQDTIAPSARPALEFAAAEQQIGLGVLTAEIGLDLVDEVIELAGCREKRRRLLPARTVVFFVLGL